MNLNELNAAGVGESTREMLKVGYQMQQSELGITDVEPWPEAVDGKALLEALSVRLTRHVMLPAWASEALALWVLHTYAFELRDVTAYLGLESPEKRCGKTTLLSVLSKLVWRAVAAANISSPAFFRVIEELRPTLLIDEADTLLQGNEELRGILNAGYSRDTAYVMRVAVGKSEVRRAKSEVEEREMRNDECRMTNGRGGNGKSWADATKLARFSCWCPKVMAAIGRLPDTLADRCILIRMQRKMASEVCERLRDLDGTLLRRQCARFVRDHWQAIAQARPEIPPTLNDRAADIWEPLLVLADLAGGDWPERGRQAAVHLSASTEEHSPIGSLLLDLFYSFAVRGGDRAFSRDLVQGLQAYADRPWKELSRGKPITELWLAQQLRPYGIRPRCIWIHGVHAKGYMYEEFTEVFRRYIPRSEAEAFRRELLQQDPEQDQKG